MPFLLGLSRQPLGDRAHGCFSLAIVRRICPMENSADPLPDPSRRLGLGEPDIRQRVADHGPCNLIGPHMADVREHIGLERLEPVFLVLLVPPVLLCAAITLAAAWRNVGMPCALRRSKIGSSPSSTQVRISRARSRAVASETFDALPKPKSPRFPSFCARHIQLFPPPGLMKRNRPSPSLSRPGHVAAFTAVAESFPMPPNLPHFQSVTGGLAGMNVDAKHAESRRKAGLF